MNKQQFFGIYLVYNSFRKEYKYFFYLHAISLYLRSKTFTMIKTQIIIYENMDYYLLHSISKDCQVLTKKLAQHDQQEKNNQLFGILRLYVFCPYNGCLDNNEPIIMHITLLVTWSIHMDTIVCVRILMNILSSDPTKVEAVYSTATKCIL